MNTAWTRSSPGRSSSQAPQSFWVPPAPAPAGALPPRPCPGPPPDSASPPHSCRLPAPRAGLPSPAHCACGPFPLSTSPNTGTTTGLPHAPAGLEERPPTSSDSDPVTCQAGTCSLSEPWSNHGMGIIVLCAPRMPWAGTKGSAPQEGLALTPCSLGNRAQPGPRPHPPSPPAAERGRR